MREACAGLALIVMSAVWCTGAEPPAERALGRFAAGGEVVAQRAASGQWGLAVRGRGASFAQSELVQLETMAAGDTAPHALASGYERVHISGGVLTGNATVALGTARIVVEDEWRITGAALRLHRNLKVLGNGSGGFLSGATLETATLPRDRVQIFAPGIVYGDTQHLTRSAIGGADSFAAGRWSAMRIREDRLPAPVVALQLPGGEYVAVLDAAPVGDTIVADSRDTEPHTVIDDRLRFGSLGIEPARDRLAVGYWFPGTEGVVTYAGNTYPGGQKRVWRYRYHPVRDGVAEAYTVEFLFGNAPSFAACYREVWRHAWATLQPEANSQDIEAARGSMLDMLGDHVESAPNGLKGIDNFLNGADVAKEASHHAVLGFCGKNLEAANYLLEDRGPRAAEHHEAAGAIFDSFVKLKMNPPVGEGFSLKDGSPVLAIPRDGVVYLRSFGDDMKAMLRAILYERRNGREHPTWLAWAQSFADWLLTQQRADGGFPRSWKPVTGEVADASPQSSYNAVPFLLLLGDATGDAKYTAAAQRAGEFVWRASNSGRFVGGTIDNPDVIDKEAGTLSLEAFLALFEHTHAKPWLDRARAAADYAETWMYVWNVPMPADESDAALHWKKGVPTTGLQLISSGHSLVDAYMAYDVDEYARLYKYTGDAHYREVARILLHNTLGMMALPGRLYDLRGPGWQQEHWSLAPMRGYGIHRAWLPWVSTSHLNGIFELENFDPALFAELCSAPPAQKR